MLCHSRVVNEADIIYKQPKIGRIKEVIALDATKPHASHIALEVFKFLLTLHVMLHVPCLELTDEHVIVRPKVCPSVAILHLSQIYMHCSLMLCAASMFSMIANKLAVLGQLNNLFCRRGKQQLCATL